MFKKISKISAVLLALLVSVMCFAVCSSAEAKALKLDGPTTAKVGTEIEVSLKANEDGILGINGKISYDGVNLVYKDTDSDIENWLVTTQTSFGEISFVASDEYAKSPAGKGDDILTFTFAVVGYPQNGKQVVKASALKASDGEALKDVGIVTHTVKAPVTAQNNNTQGSDSDEGETITIVIPGEKGESEFILEPKDNNFLKSLVIEGVEFTPAFDPEVKKYEAVVPFEVDRVSVTAIPQVENATVTVENEELTYIGRNIVKVVVLSESGLKRTYRIYIERQAPTNLTDGEEDNSFPLWAIIAIIVGAIAVLAVIAFIIIIVMRRRRKQN